MRRPIAPAPVTLLLATFFLAAFACGGGPAKAPSVPSAGGGGHATAPKRRADEDTSSEPAPKPCADGSCVACGDGVCPSGFYCERPKSGATGCAWVAPCVERPTCACLAPHVKGCACEDKAGVAFVTCS